MFKPTPYMRNTYRELWQLMDEGAEPLPDGAVGDMLLDGMVVNTIPKEAADMLRAMDMAGITAAQAAQVIYVLFIKYGDKVK